MTVSPAELKRALRQINRNAEVGDDDWAERWEYCGPGDLPSPIVLFIDSSPESEYIKKEFDRIGMPHQLMRSREANPRFPLVRLPNEGPVGAQWQGVLQIENFFLTRFRRRRRSRRKVS